MKLIDYIKSSRKGRAAHDLELKAMRDRMTAEALEGLEDIDDDHSSAIEELQRRIAARAAGGNRHKYVQYAAAAAAVLIIGTVGLLTLRHTPVPEPGMTGNSATDPLRVSAADTVAVSPDPQTTTSPAVIAARQSQPDTSAPAVASKKEPKRADSTHPLNPTVPVPKEQNRDSVIIPAFGQSGQPKFTGSTGAKPRQDLRTIAPLYAPGKGGDLASLRIRGTGDDTTSVRYIVDGEEHSDIAWLKADQIASIQIERGQEGKRMVIQTKAAAAGQEEEPFVALGGQPSFQGGDLVAFKKWVQERIRKPEAALQNGIRNRVVASFVIDTMGRLCDIQVLLTPDQSLADEAVRVLKSSPLWEPGRQGDKKVPVKYTLPVDF